MASTAVSNTFNIGQNTLVTLIASTGEIIPAESLGHLIMLEASADDTEIRVTPITRGGKPLYGTIPHGFTGRLEFARFNGSLAGMLITLQQQFFDNGVTILFDINVQVLNGDGSIDIYTFQNCALSKGSFGNFKGDKEVDQTVNFRSSNCVITSANTGPLAA